MTLKLSSVRTRQ